MGAPPPGLVPSLPGMPPAPPGDNEGTQSSEIDGVLHEYVHIHTSLPITQFFSIDAYAKDCKCDKDFNGDLLIGKTQSTG